MLKIINLLDNSESLIDSQTLEKQRVKSSWIEVENATDTDIDQLSKRLNVPRDILKPPKLETYANLHLLESNAVLQLSSFEDNNSEPPVPIIVCFSKDFVVTIASKSVGALERAKARLHKNKLDSPGSVVHSILDEVAATYFEYLERVEDRTVEVEERLIENPNKETVKELFGIKSKLISFNKLLWHERGALFSLKKTNAPYMTRELSEMIDDVHDDFTRQIDIVETYREILSDALAAYLSTVSNQTNLSIKLLSRIVLYLTVISTILVFPNTIATVFGIPALGSNVDPVLVLSFLAVSTVIPSIWLLRKQWLRSD